MQKDFVYAPLAIIFLSALAASMIARFRRIHEGRVSLALWIQRLIGNVFSRTA